jgi:hypothetical protein
VNRKGVSAPTDCSITTTTTATAIDRYLGSLSFPHPSFFRTSRFYIMKTFCNNDEDCCFSLTDSRVRIGFASNYNILIVRPRTWRTIRRSYIYLDCMSLPFIFVFVKPFLLLTHGIDPLIGTMLICEVILRIKQSSLF